MKTFIILFLVIPSISYARKQITFYDRDGDQYNEEKQTQFISQHKILKNITEIDSNKDQRYDREITVYFQHSKMKRYEITRIDENHDGNWDKKKIEIKPLVDFY